MECGRGMGGETEYGEGNGSNGSEEGAVADPEGVAQFPLKPPLNYVV